MLTSLQAGLVSVVVLSVPAAAQDGACAAILARLHTVREPIRACFIEHGRPLIAASQERPETIATAVDIACQPQKAAVARALLPCMRYDQASDAVERFAKELRGLIVQAVVEYRAGLLPNR